MSNLIHEVFDSFKKIKLYGYTCGNKEYKKAKEAMEEGWPAIPGGEIERYVNEGHWIGGVIPEGYIVVDIDDEQLGKIVLEWVIRAGIHFIGIKTPRGNQFIFQDIGRVTRQWTDYLTLSGIHVDYRLSTKGYIVLPTKNTVGREVIHLPAKDLSPMPLCFLSVRRRKETDAQVDKILEGGRNTSLHSHACKIREWNIAHALNLTEEAKLIVLQEVNQILCQPPLPAYEVGKILESAESYAPVSEPPVNGRPGDDKKKDEERLSARLVHIALYEVIETLNKYIRLPEAKVAVLLAFWILGTYCYQAFQYFGYLALRSATPRCGKSRLLKLLALLAKGKPTIRTTPTAATLFRSTQVVTILDEVDKLRNKDKEVYGEILAILNCGFESGGIVERVVKSKEEGFVVKEFPVYGPKALAGIEGLADSLADRAFHVQMLRTPSRMPRLNIRRLEPMAKQVRADMQGFADKFGKDLEKIYAELPDELPHLKAYDDRFQDIAEPLFVMAAIIDANFPDGQSPLMPELIKGLQKVAGKREPSGREKQIISFIEEVKKIIGEDQKPFVPTGTILKFCAEREDLSHIATGKALSGFLKHFDLVPTSSGSLRGYNISQEWVREWSVRYSQKGAE